MLLMNDVTIELFRSKLTEADIDQEYEEYMKQVSRIQTKERPTT